VSDKTDETPQGAAKRPESSAGTPARSANPAGPQEGDDSLPFTVAAPERRKAAMGWRTGDILRAAAVVLAFYIFLRFAWTASALIFTTFMGVLFGLAVASGVDRLEKYKVRRGIGAALIVLTFFGVLSGFFALMAPTLRSQGTELRRKLPEAFEKVEQWVEKRQQGMFGAVIGGVGSPAASGDSAAAARTDTPSAAAAPAADTTKGGAQGPLSFRDRVEQILSGAGQHLFRFVSSTIAVFAGILLVIFLSIYIAADPGLYRRGVLHLVPHDNRQRFGEVMTAMGDVMRKWLVTQMIAMLVIGVVTTVILLVLRVKAAFALGFIAGLLEFVPTVGPILSAVPAVAMALLDSPQKALIVAIAYVGIQFVENQLLIPILMKGGLDLPPAVTILSQAVMALLFGFLGLLVAVPLTAAAMTAVKMLYVEDVVGDPASVLPAKDG